MNGQKKYRIGFNITSSKSEVNKGLNEKIAQALNDKALVKMFAFGDSVFGMYLIDAEELVKSLHQKIPTIVTEALKSSHQEQSLDTAMKEFSVTVFLENPHSPHMGVLSFDAVGSTPFSKPIEFNGVDPVLPLYLTVYCDKKEVMQRREAAEKDLNEVLPTWDRDLDSAFRYVAAALTSVPAGPAN